jgi:hypothetical protein
MEIKLVLSLAFDSVFSPISVVSASLHSANYDFADGLGIRLDPIAAIHLKDRIKEREGTRRL